MSVYWQEAWTRQNSRTQMSRYSLAIVTPVVSLEELHHFAGELELDRLDRVADLQGPRQLNFCGLAAVNVGRNPGVDAATTLTAVGDGSPSVGRFRDGGERGPEHVEGKVVGEGADEGSVQ